MAEENHNNQSVSGSKPADEAANPSNTASGSAGSASSAGIGGAAPKKPKTENQLARERERRRRRRKKKAESKVLGGSNDNGDRSRLSARENVLRPGDDIQLLAIKEAQETKKLQPPEDSQLIEAPSAVEEIEKVQPDVPLILPEMEAPEPPLNDVAPEPPLEEPQSIVTAEPDHLSEPLENSQKVFEESPSYNEEDSALERDSAQPDTDNLIVTEPPAREDNLEELPVKQGILGKFFDKFAELVQGRKTQGLPSSMNKTTETIVTEVGTEKTDVSGISSLLANLIKFLLVIALVIGAFWLGSSLKVIDRISGLFAGGKVEEQLVIGDNSQVVIDPLMIRKWGFDTARLIGSNLGDSNDLTYNVFFNANYFGKLKDPIFYGETGISAAIYYGFGKEVQYAQNRFIVYVQYLSSVVNANSVKIEDVLKSNARRDIALDNYIQESQEIFDQGNSLRKEINVQIDDLKVSINTLAPDKIRYETDFFASMDTHDGEKANALLAKFIEAGQKNVELTAKQNALQRLTQNYETELLKLKTRIQAVQANRDALISGVTVTEIPGGGLDLIKQ